MELLDKVVVGAGVVGLAAGRALARTGRDVVVLEAENQIGMHCSSRNSEVIHAGIYYPEESLKARLCVAGKEMLYAYCKEHKVAHQRIGKLIVATDAGDIERLDAVLLQARKNGVTDLQILTANDVRRIEPNIECCAALLSPSTGIIDSHELLTALQGDLENAGGFVVLNNRVTNVSAVNDRLRFVVGDQKYECRTLINAASLWATDLATSLRERAMPAIESRPHGGLPQVHFAKGHYFSLPGKSPFKHLIYPVPSGGGLGIHATNDLGGSARFGPDVTWIEDIDYAFNESRKQDFVSAITKYYPDLDESKLRPAYTGIRPKLHGPGAPPADFVIQTEADHGVRGLVNLFGIESPGLTSSLAIADFVAETL